MFLGARFRIRSEMDLIRINLSGKNHLFRILNICETRSESKSKQSSDLGSLSYKYLFRGIIKCWHYLSWMVLSHELYYFLPRIRILRIQSRIRDEKKTSEAGNYKRKQKIKKTRKQNLDRESVKKTRKKRKKTRSRPRKRPRKKEKLSYFLDRFLSQFLGRVLVFFYKFPPFTLVPPTAAWFAYHQVC